MPHVRDAEFVKRPSIDPETITKYRIKWGLTQQQFARFACVSIRRVEDWEQNYGMRVAYRMPANLWLLARIRHQASIGASAKELRALIAEPDARQTKGPPKRAL